MQDSFFPDNKNKKTSKQIAQTLHLKHLEFKQVFLKLNNIFNIGYDVDQCLDLQDLTYIFNHRQIVYLKKIFAQLNTYVETL